MTKDTFRPTVLRKNNYCVLLLLWIYVNLCRWEKSKKRKQLNINFNHVENILPDGAAKNKWKEWKEFRFGLIKINQCAICKHFSMRSSMNNELINFCWEEPSFHYGHFRYNFIIIMHCNAFEILPMQIQFAFLCKRESQLK